MPETAVVVDPFRAYNWRLEIGGGAQAYFTACSGMGITVDVIKYREAGNLQIVRAIPGQVNYEPITLYYGLTPSREIFDWLMAGVEGRADRRNASIIVLNSQGTEEATAPRWNLDNAWVAAWRGAQLNAMSLEVAIESITLVFDRMTRA
jgi:phage tail-like protein